MSARQRTGFGSMVVAGLLLCLIGSTVVASQRDKEEVSLGETTIEWRKNDQGISGLRVTFLVESTRQILWAVLTDYARFPELFRNVRRATVLKESAVGCEVEFVVDAKIRTFQYVLDRRYVEREKRIAWTKISGDLGAIYGGWTIADGPQPELLQVTYESYVELEWYVPVFAAKMSAGKEAKEMVRALRARLAESRSE